MGSHWSLRWHGAVAPATVEPVVVGLLADADRTFSLWRRDSELAAFNAHAAVTPFPCSELLRAATSTAMAVAAATDGAYDPTVLPLSRLYRAHKAGGPAPTAAELAAAVARVGWRHVRVQGDALEKDLPAVELDLDGLVAGLCADRLATRLDAIGVRDFLLDVTGEIVCRGVRPDGKPWQVGIVDPGNAVPGAEGTVATVPLADRALCTSGDYRNFVVDGERVLTHVFDPRTGQNPAHGVVSVSVLARSCALADGLGTALMVAGPDRAAACLDRGGEPGLAAWFVVAAADGSLRSVPVGWPEAFALDGSPRWPAALAAELRQRREAELAAAERQFATSGDVADRVWVGRRLAYLGRFREAIAWFGAGLAATPDEPHLLRHRGHRYVTVREFAAARSDLERAAAAVAGKPDEPEPDGQPVAGRTPHGTLHYAIHYHLGLACFLLREFAAAESAWRACWEVAHNDESRVAVAHWLWCARMRRGDAAGAAAAVAPITGELDVVENRGYWQLCRLYRGELAAAALTTGDDSKGAVTAFGVAHWLLVQGDAAAAGRLRAVAARPDWTSFGVIAAEAECAALAAKARR